MVSEDVVTSCAHARVTYSKHRVGSGAFTDRWFCTACEMDFVPAAEVRELRKDKARLDWVLSECFLADYSDLPRPERPMGDFETREDIDAAMAGEGE
jgi:hypothetical protein